MSPCPAREPPAQVRLRRGQTGVQSTRSESTPGGVTFLERPGNPRIRQRFFGGGVQDVWGRRFTFLRLSFGQAPGFAPGQWPERSSPKQASHGPDSLVLPSTALQSGRFSLSFRGIRLHRTPPRRHPQSPRLVPKKTSCRSSRYGFGVGRSKGEGARGMRKGIFERTLPYE